MRTLLLLLLLLAAGAPAAQAQSGKFATAKPCCTIAAVNERTGIVTARERSTGKTFRFQVKDRALLKTLTAGQGVWADFAAKQVSVRPAEPTANLSVNPAEPAGQPAAQPGAQCCPILPEVSP